MEKSFDERFREYKEGLNKLKQTFYEKKERVRELQSNIADILESKYFKLYKKQEKEINLMKHTAYHVPKFVKKLKDSKIELILKDIDKLWDEMNNIGLEIRSYY